MRTIEDLPMPRSWMQLQRQLMDGRIMAGWTQEQLAERLGVDRKTIVRWESGGRNIGALDLFRYADALGICIISFFRDERDQSAPSQVAA